jgi:hypothetical protein
MDKEALVYLGQSRVGCLAVAMPDGSLRSSALHYSHTAEPLKILIQTSRDTRKAEAFLNGRVAPASFTVGFSEEEWLTLQLDGTARLLKEEGEIAAFKKIHHAKIVEAAQYVGKDTIYIEFTPTWHRYTDLTSRRK